MQQTCDPLTARMWFKLRTPVNWIVTLGLFTVLVFVLQTFLPFYICDVFAIALAYGLFFYVLDKRTVSIICSCGKHIEGNTPWVCGVCKKENRHTADFPFLGRCESEGCGAEPKAYKCHHCQELVFFSQDRQKTNFAQCVGQPESAEIKQETGIVDIGKKRMEEKLALQHELDMTRLQSELQVVKLKAEPPQKKTQREILEERFAEFKGSRMTVAEIIQREKAANALIFKDDPEELKKANLLIDDWVKKNIHRI